MTTTNDETLPTATHQRISKLGPELALWSVVAIWSTTFIAMKDAFSYLDPLPYTLFRFIWINVLAFGVLWFQHRRDDGVPLTIRRQDLPRLLVASIVGYTLYQLCFVLGLDRSSIFTLSLLVALVPLFTMLMLVAMGEPTPPYGWAGLGVAVVGVVVFLSDKRSDDDTLLGALLSLGAGVAFAFYGVVNRAAGEALSAGDLLRLLAAVRHDPVYFHRWFAIVRSGLGRRTCSRLARDGVGRDLPGLRRVSAMELRYQATRSRNSVELQLDRTNTERGSVRDLLR
jgi:hypothetical protein